ncbi:MAG: hypothetical protein KDA89_23905, partial [Planctomycetaceae bacterium]|nr:hypothetical protein [Planctomycetaceae bacterium]
MLKRRTGLRPALLRVILRLQIYPTQVSSQPHRDRHPCLPDISGSITERHHPEGSATGSGDSRVARS